MDFTQIMNMQIELDKNIEKKHGILDEDLTNRKLVALLVEIAEFANEIKPFKYWKLDKTIDREKVIEEFVDGIHFFLSLVWNHKASPIVKPLVISQNPNEQLAALFEETSRLNSVFTVQQLEKALAIYMGMAEIINITEKEVIEFYIMKNKVNYERLATGY